MNSFGFVLNCFYSIKNKVAIHLVFSVPGQQMSLVKYLIWGIWVHTRYHILTWPHKTRSYECLYENYQYIWWLAECCSKELQNFVFALKFYFGVNGLFSQSGMPNSLGSELKPVFYLLYVEDEYSVWQYLYAILHFGVKCAQFLPAWETDTAGLEWRWFVMVFENGNEYHSFYFKKKTDPK